MDSFSYDSDSDTAYCEARILTGDRRLRFALPAAAVFRRPVVGTGSGTRAWHVWTRAGWQEDRAVDVSVV